MSGAAVRSEGHTLWPLPPFGTCVHAQSAPVTHLSNIFTGLNVGGRLFTCSGTYDKMGGSIAAA